MAATFTPREKETVRLFSLGCTADEAARILKLAPTTVGNHRAHAMRKLGVDNAAALTRLAIQHRVTSMKDKLTPAEKRKSGRKNDGWN